MAEEAQARGADIRPGATFLDANRDEEGLMQVTFGVFPEHGTRKSTPSVRETVRARFLIGADGSRSKVAQRMGLDQNTHLLAAAEWLVDGVSIDQEKFFMIMNHDLAPGYCIWLAPHGETIALGVAGYSRKFNPTESLRIGQKLYGEMVDMSQMRVVQRKGGTISIGGRLHRVYRNDSRGRRCCWVTPLDSVALRLAAASIPRSSAGDWRHRQWQMKS